MSIEEIRNQKALALLEFTEAEKLVNQLEREAKMMGKRIEGFGAQLERNPASILEDDPEKLSDLSAANAYALARKLKDATDHLAQTIQKKHEFGLD